MHAGTVLGLVVVNRTAAATRPGVHREPRSARCVEVGRRLGLLLHNRELDSALQATLDDLRRTNDDLRASRARLAAASDDVRRRIERDLHDGAQQHLVAIAVNLSLAAELIEDDPAAARELVEQTRLDAHRTVGELRDLAHGIYPSLLIESGLGQALRSLSLARLPRRRFIDRRRRRRPVRAARSRRPSTSAASRRCRTRRSTHPARACDVALRRDGRALRVEVVDDGPACRRPRGATAVRGCRT